MQSFNTTIGLSANASSAGQPVDFDGGLVSGCLVTNESGVSIQYTLDGAAWITVPSGSTAAAAVASNPSAFRLRKTTADSYPVPVGLRWTVYEALPSAALNSGIVGGVQVADLKYGARAQGVTNYAALRPFFQAMADARYSPQLISYAGDSTVFGLYADGTSTATDAATAPNSAPSQLAQILNSALGTTATFSINGADSRNAFVGGANSNSVGIGGLSRGITTGQSVTLSLPACGSIDIIYYENNGSGGGPVTGGFSYDFGAGAVTGSVAYASTIDSYKKVTISGTGSAGDLVVTGASANSAYICQVNCYTTGGVIVGRNGRSGFTSADLLGTGQGNTTNAAGQARLLKAFGMGSPSLVILQVGHNDCTLQATAGQMTTPAVYAANLSAIAAQIAPIPLLLVSQPDPSNSDAALTHKYRDYWAKARGLAVAGSNIAHLSIADFWGDFAAAKAAGYCSDGSGVHPLRKGYGSIAKILATTLSGADLYKTQL